MDSPPLVVPLPDIAATRALGAALGGMLTPGDVVLLSGPLGAGKSELARAALRVRLDDPDLEAPSPTFTLVQTYQAPDGLEIWHIDLYRLESEAEAVELGLEEIFETGAALIEWPDRLGGLAPADRLDIDLATGHTGREAHLTPQGRRWRERIDRI